MFKEAGIHACSLSFYTIINGKPTSQKTVILRKTDTENTTKVNLYHDSDEPVAYQLSWHGNNGTVTKPVQELQSNFLFLMPPMDQ